MEHTLITKLLVIEHFVALGLIGLGFAVHHYQWHMRNNKSKSLYVFCESVMFYTLVQMVVLQGCIYTSLDIMYRAKTSLLTNTTYWRTGLLESIFTDNQIVEIPEQTCRGLHGGLLQLKYSAPKIMCTLSSYDITYYFLWMLLVLLHVGVIKRSIRRYKNLN